MVRLLRITRSIDWMAKALVANRDALPIPEGMVDLIVPNIDIFGTDRQAELQVATVNGALGALEVSHDPVDPGRCRLYLSMEYSHDDIVARRLRPGRIIPTAAGFPFAGMRDEASRTASQFLAVRNFTVGPGQRASLRVDALGGGARIIITVAWVEFALGEYLRSIS